MSPDLMSILVKSPNPCTCQYSGVFTKWAEVMVPSGMTRALLRGSSESAWYKDHTTKHRESQARLAILTDTVRNDGIFDIPNLLSRLPGTKDTKVVNRVEREQTRDRCLVDGSPHGGLGRVGDAHSTGSGDLSFDGGSANHGGGEGEDGHCGSGAIGDEEKGKGGRIDRIGWGS